MENQTSSDRDLRGWLNALVAFGWWGFVFPLILLWMKSVGQAEIQNRLVRWSFELLAWRIAFCFLFCVLMLWLSGKLGLWIEVFRQSHLLLGFGFSAVLIFVNWSGFIIGAMTDNLSQASLGYYMGPLFNVFLGYLFLAEKLRRNQFLAVGVAATGIFWLAWRGGEIPWIAISLATSFGLYGLVRKRIIVDSVVGMTMECLYCLPVCLCILVFFAGQSEGLVFLRSDWELKWIVIFNGPATAIPLICFAIAARKLRLGTLGFIQFIAPTGQLMVAMVFEEKLITYDKLVGFGLVWASVAIYLIDLWVHQKKRAHSAS